MKVVLFCGGMGMRLREVSDAIPKPMVEIGYRPILWHIMKYYAHYGHKDFILCLGYKADVIKNYFLNYNECQSNDFVLSKGSKEVKLFNTDIDDWNITFADTGVASNIGQRLTAVRKYLEGEEVFLANYADGLTDLHLPCVIDNFLSKKKVASFVAVKPRHSFHVVSMKDDDTVSEIRHLSRSNIWINGGFFTFTNRIFDFIRNGEELVNEPFQRLIDEGELITYKYDGFWASMDTFKDKQELEEFYQKGNPPWQVWNSKGTAVISQGSGS
ncbi:MAG: glucose-1-phosphate cytidylyltransferase [Deltaproteobacteria bacterium]|nr:glucose-1-phosphate cytidylyltransferase [Deltaproteobacteria bacterium]PWB62057.1 MAG: glucose-1-phosphate cytidylyltransferase [Deltaproteobacteria bacterium]